MRPYLVVAFVIILCACNGRKEDKLTAQDIVDKAISVAGGDRYKNSQIAFTFRDHKYVLERISGKRILKRITLNDTSNIVDVRQASGLQRFINDSLVVIPDSMAVKYANSVNSVHYFAYLPYGLNDAAVNKKLLGEEQLNDTQYYKVEVTFEQEGGGEDFEDTYVYWFNKKTFKPDYLAYEFHVDGGGTRFREAYNERYVNGIRFVDYRNYKPLQPMDVHNTGQLFDTGGLELLSAIELSEIEVNQDSYN